MRGPHPAIDQLFGAPRALIGMLHLWALPGTPANRHSVAEIAEHAVREAEIYADSGFDGVLIENMHDLPYLRGTVGPEITAAMAVAGAAVRSAVDLPLGVQVLAGANRQALAVAKACGASFVRVEGFVFAHVADEGIHQSDAGELLRYQRLIGAEDVCIFADVKKKHCSHALTADVDLVETVHAAEFFGADGVIVTGVSTGRAADADELERLAAADPSGTGPALLVGSGIREHNVADYRAADALIVGSSIKRGGDWRAEVCPERAERLVRAFHGRS